MRAQKGLSPRHPAQAQGSLLTQCSMYSKTNQCLMPPYTFLLISRKMKEERIFTNCLNQFRKIKHQGNVLWLLH